MNRLSDHSQIPSWRRVAVPAACILAICAAWSLWPLPPVQGLEPTIERAEVKSAPPEARPLDVAAFRAPLWVAPPLPPQAAAPPPPPPPLRLQLVAIVRDGPDFKGAVYDPDTDKLTIVGAGDSIAGRIIERVRVADLTLRDGSQSRTLALKTEGGVP